ncbi:MAG TPA: hypothetical protein VMS65_11480 [Polyangiaceae bacterium]|nr:hypothetical protein [Polyangiaceae bacterium]
MGRRTALLFSITLVVACERKAPGPKECRAFALAVHGLSAEEELARGARRSPSLRDEVDGLTRECLVVPYDRPLLRCLSETGRSRACRIAFERRRAAR